MQLIVITPDTTAANEPEIVNEMFAGGLPRLHLRKPSFTFEDHRSYLDSIDQQFHSRIVLQNCFELYQEYELGGIHLTSAMRKDPSVWLKIKPLAAAEISSSFHSWQEILDNKFPYDYVLISPVFDSISKPGYKASIELPGAASTRQRLTAQNGMCPALIGLGGIGVEQIDVLSENGFDGAAILGAIWNGNYPVHEFGKIIQAVTAHVE
jgi:thiamine-phosphate pyrophosphorylase